MGRPLRRELLGQALEIRSAMDDALPYNWPAGSAERLLLRSWPAYDGAPVPDLEELRGTLGTYFWTSDHEGLARAGEQARLSAYVRVCLDLADWVGEGREVTSIGVLRPAVAREAFTALDVWAWSHEIPAVARHGAQGARPESLDHARAHALSHWRSAADFQPLNQLWDACRVSGLIDIGPRRADADDLGGVARCACRRRGRWPARIRCSPTCGIPTSSGP